MARNIWLKPRHLLTLQLWFGQRYVRKTLPKIGKRFPNAVGGGHVSTGCCKKSAGDTWIATSAARRARPYRTSLICSYGAAFFNEIKQGFPSTTYNKKQGHG